MRRALLPFALGLILVAVAAAAVHGAWRGPVRWTPDGLYYQARVLELRGASHDAAIARVFDGSISRDLRARDPQHTGNRAWVAYNEPFYQRRVAVPLAGAAVYGAAGDRSLLILSLLGYVAAVVALYGLLLLRFRVATAFVVTAAAALLPPLTHHASFPLTDTWGLALETTALGAAILTLDRGLKWLALWIPAIAILALTRDSSWIPILAVTACAIRFRSRVPTILAATGVAAALPALLLYRTPVRDLLALLVNNSTPSSDTSWGFIASHYPGAVVDLVRANVGFLRRGEWYTALFLVGGTIACVVGLLRRRDRSPAATMLIASAVVALLYVLAAPAFSAFRLELVFVPIASWGVALVAEAAAKRLQLAELVVRARPGVLTPARARRP